MKRLIHVAYTMLTITITLTVGLIILLVECLIVNKLEPPDKEDLVERGTHKESDGSGIITTETR